MRDTSPNGHPGKIGNGITASALLIGLLAAGVGWFLASRPGASNGIARRARAVGRGLRQRLDAAGELTHGLSNRIPSLGRIQGTASSQTARRKIHTGEPMAGYGA
jgi:hypothetical protein